MTIQIKLDNNQVNFKLIGSIDTKGGSELSNKFAEITKNKALTCAIFDLSEVPTTNSAGIGKLLKYYKYFDGLGGKMEIKGISPDLLKQFQEIHLDNIIPVS